MNSKHNQFLRHTICSQKNLKQTPKQQKNTNMAMASLPADSPPPMEDSKPIDQDPIVEPDHKPSTSSTVTVNVEAPTTTSMENSTPKHLHARQEGSFTASKSKSFEDEDDVRRSPRPSSLKPAGGSISPGRMSLNDSFIEMKSGKGIARRISSVDGGSSLEIRRSSVNRFGFLFDDEDVGLYGEEFLEQIASEEKMNPRELARLNAQYNERLKKWDNMTKKWSRNSDNLLKKRIRKGIPEPYRGKAWKLILKSRIPKDAPYKDPSDIPYDQLVHERNPDAEYCISVDVPRSFPKHVRFMETDGEGQRALGRALKAFSNLDKEIGYCQGMSFIMATLLMYFTEDEALWAFSCLMGPPYNLKNLFLPGLPKLLQSVAVLEKLMNVFMPDLLNHLQENNMIASIYAAPWFMTVFIVGFPFELTLRIFDCFFNEGEKIFYRVALGLLMNLKDELLACDNMDKIMTTIKKGQRRINADKIFEAGFKLKLTRKQIETFDEEYQESLKNKPVRQRRKPNKKAKSDIPEETKEMQ
jgi:hypothetical protein